MSLISKVIPVREDSVQPQFEIAAHYNVMAELDADIHGNKELSRREVELALRLIGCVPETVFLPCFGTGRHIGPLLDAGVQRIVGVDLSPECVKKARQEFSREPHVSLILGDLCAPAPRQRQFDAVLLLGNSFGDLVDDRALKRFVAGITTPLKPGGCFVMDYIGTNYLKRCQSGAASEWSAMLSGCPVRDIRTPRYDKKGRVMTIEVEVRQYPYPIFGAIPGAILSRGTVLWRGYYQKKVLGHIAVQHLFDESGVRLQPRGKASSLNEYFLGHDPSEFGMISQSEWWIGTKTPA